MIFGVSTDMTFDNFKKMAHACWIKKYDFLTIDKDSDFNNGR